MKKNINRSRLSRRLEKQTKKTLFFSLLGIIIVFLFLGKFGIPILVNLSLFMGQKNAVESSLKDSNFYISPPTLNPLIEATNSAQITISGFASKDETINLYINDQLIDKARTKNDGTFVFQDVTLSKGENTVRVKALIEDREKRESEFSPSYSVTLKNEPPMLTLDTPSNGQSFSKDENSINVSGKTEAGNKVTVNGFWAIVDESGKFSYNLSLRNGDNEIVVVATDIAGNKTEMERKVSYSP